HQTSTLIFLLLRRTPQSTLFPYTTLFRSALFCPRCDDRKDLRLPGFLLHRDRPDRESQHRQHHARVTGETLHPVAAEGRPAADRSEEHTSELQSRENLVCRLLLEKKKTNV